MGKSRKIEETYEEVEQAILEPDIDEIQAQINSARKLTRNQARELIQKLDLIKGSLNKRVFRDLRNEIASKVEETEEILEPGPKITEKDILNIQRKISAFFRSPFAKEFPKDEKISFYLGGSLITGFSQNKSSPFYGQPTDKGRVSDVDISVFISSNFFNSLFTSSKLVETHLLHKRTLPIGTEEKFKENYAGPFQALLEDLSKLTIASRERNVNFTFFEHSLLDLFEINKEGLIKLSEISTW